MRITIDSDIQKALRMDWRNKAKFVYGLFAWLVITYNSVAQSARSVPHCNPDTLPHCQGTHPVGSRVFYMTDGSRYDSLLKTKRPVIFTVWYPSSQGPKTGLADYVQDKTFIDTLIAQQYYNQDNITLSRLKCLKTRAYQKAPIIQSGKPMSLLIFSPGLAVTPFNYSILCEDLASKGFIVVLMHHLYESTTKLPDGRVVDASMDKDSTLNDMISNCIEDVSFVTRAIRQSKGDAGKMLESRIDWHNIVACGQSIGGNIAMESSIDEPLVTSSVNLDGGFFDHLKDRHMNKPSLVIIESPIYTDEELEKKGRTKEGDKKRRQQFYDQVADLAAADTPGQIYSFQISGTGHMSFSDAPYLMPTMLTRFGGKIIDKDRCRKIIVNTITAFVNDRQKGTKNDAYLKNITRFEEIKDIRVF